MGKGQKLILKNLQKLSPFFILLYLFLFFLSIFSPIIKSNINWLYFHISALLFFCIYLSNKQSHHFLQYGVRFFSWLRGLRRSEIIKLILIIIVLLSAFYLKINLIPFLILVYGLVSFYFALDSRIAGSFALILLASCAVSLIFKNGILAEYLAIFCYYFLIIVAINSLIELKEGVNRQ